MTLAWGRIAIVGCLSVAASSPSSVSDPATRALPSSVSSSSCTRTSICCVARPRPRPGSCRPPLRDRPGERGAFKQVALGAEFGLPEVTVLAPCPCPQVLNHGRLKRGDDRNPAHSRQRRPGRQHLLGGRGAGPCGHLARCERHRPPRPALLDESPRPRHAPARLEPVFGQHALLLSLQSVPEAPPGGGAPGGDV